MFVGPARKLTTLVSPSTGAGGLDALSSAACFQDKHFPGADSVLILEVEREFHALRQLRDCGLLHVMYIFFVEMVEVMVG